MQVYDGSIKFSVGADLVRDYVDSAVIAHEMRSYRESIPRILSRLIRQPQVAQLNMVNLVA
jgi:hypothetical protein